MTDREGRYAGPPHSGRRGHPEPHAATTLLPPVTGPGNEAVPSARGDRGAAETEPAPLSAARPAPNQFTLDEAAEIAGVSERTLRRWVKKGSVPFSQPGGPGGKLFFPANFLERGGSPDAAGAARRGRPGRFSA